MASFILQLDINAILALLECFVFCSLRYIFYIIEEPSKDPRHPDYVRTSNFFTPEKFKSNR